MALYNTFTYNEEQFNAFSLNDLVTLAETLTVSLSIVLSDAVFANEFLSRQITNKGLSDTVQTAEWINPKRAPAQSDWTD